MLYGGETPQARRGKNLIEPFCDKPGRFTLPKNFSLGENQGLV
jgi:hypothetical protein